MKFIKDQNRELKNFIQETSEEERFNTNTDEFEEVDDGEEYGIEEEQTLLDSDSEEDEEIIQQYET